MTKSRISGSFVLHSPPRHWPVAAQANHKGWLIMGKLACSKYWSSSPLTSSEAEEAATLK
jgi:hypothetical protein